MSIISGAYQSWFGGGDSPSGGESSSGGGGGGTSSGGSNSGSPNATAAQPEQAPSPREIEADTRDEQAQRRRNRAEASDDGETMQELAARMHAETLALQVIFAARRNDDWRRFTNFAQDNLDFVLRLADMLGVDEAVTRIVGVAMDGLDVNDDGKLNGKDVLAAIQMLANNNESQIQSLNQNGNSVLVGWSSQDGAVLESPNYDEYEVVEGDTLGNIAESNHIPVELLLAANGLSSPNDTLTQGQILALPRIIQQNNVSRVIEIDGQSVEIQGSLINIVVDGRIEQLFISGNINTTAPSRRSISAANPDRSTLLGGIADRYFQVIEQSLVTNGQLDTQSIGYQVATTRLTEVKNYIAQLSDEERARIPTYLLNYYDNITPDQYYIASAAASSAPNAYGWATDINGDVSEGENRREMFSGLVTGLQTAFPMSWGSLDLQSAGYLELRPSQFANLSSGTITLWNNETVQMNPISLPVSGVISGYSDIQPLIISSNVSEMPSLGYGQYLQNDATIFTEAMMIRQAANDIRLLDQWVNNVGLINTWNPNQPDTFYAYTGSAQFAITENRAGWNISGVQGPPSQSTPSERQNTYVDPMNQVWIGSFDGTQAYLRGIINPLPPMEPAWPYDNAPPRDSIVEMGDYNLGGILDSTLQTIGGNT